MSPKLGYILVQALRWNKFSKEMKNFYLFVQEWFARKWLRSSIWKSWRRRNKRITERSHVHLYLISFWSRKYFLRQIEGICKKKTCGMNLKTKETQWQCSQNCAKVTNCVVKMAIEITKRSTINIIKECGKRIYQVSVVNWLQFLVLVFVLVVVIARVYSTMPVIG